jgi:hypothetical protein
MLKKSQWFYHQSYDYLSIGRFKSTQSTLHRCLSAADRAASMITNREAALFQISEAARRVPRSSLSWGALIPAIFVGNVLLAIFAWFVVEWAMKIM